MNYEWYFNKSLFRVYTPADLQLYQIKTIQSHFDKIFSAMDNTVAISSKLMFLGIVTPHFY